MKYLFANWKTYLDSQEHAKLALELAQLKLANNFSNKFVVFPSMPFLGLLANHGLTIGAQDVSAFTGQNLTGETTAQTLQSLAIKYALIGHSERRYNNHENDRLLIAKINNCLKHNIIPVLCVGETQEQRSNSQEIILKQLESLYISSSIIVAYEPVWSIGTGIIPTNNEIEEILQLIKGRYNCHVLYGGSVNSKNIDTLLQLDGVDGFLIGAASTKIEEIKYISQKLTTVN